LVYKEKEMNTSVRLKKKFWPQFIKACESQWQGGGIRYALKEDKEFTDLVCEAVGTEWIGGNILKYTGEIINEYRAGNSVPEQNFFKIAVYAFIWWLKFLDENVSQEDKGEKFDRD